MQRPILVTGAHRSGTTWVGEMLCLSPRVGMLLEPFNPITPPGISSGPFDRFFLYVTEENEGPFVEPLERTLEFRYQLRKQVPRIRSAHSLGRTAQDFSAFTLNRLRRARPLFKDPIAVFSSEWLVSRFEMQPIVLIRHPAAFASSLKRLGWTHRFEHFLDQPLLLRDHLGRFEDEIRAFAERPPELVDQAILLWRLIYSAVATFRDRHPDWLYVRHEDASLDPLGTFERIFAWVGVELDDRIRAAIAEHSAAGNPTELRHRHDVRLDSKASLDSWKRRLSPEEIERIRTGVADVAHAFYSDDDW